MLKIMRLSSAVRNTIIIVVVLALASYVLVSFGEAPARVQGDILATLGKSTIKYRDLAITQENLRTNFRQLDPQFLDQIAVNNLMNDAILLNGAEEAGIVVSDDELRDYVIEIRTLPDGTFLSNEQWADMIRYKYRLQVEAFETYLREKELKIQKFRGMFSDSSFIPQEELKERFQKDNQLVKLEMLALRAAALYGKVRMEDKELQDYYNKNKEFFRSGEQRQIEFVAWDSATYEKDVTVTDEQVQEHYNSNLDRYKLDEQVQARHILIKTESKSKADALAEITKIKAEIDGGLDFAEAATKYSDDSSAPRGGDLGFFKRGAMVPAFDQKAFSSEVGVVSEPVETQFGYHLIKVEAKETARTQPLEEVAAKIKQELTARESKTFARNLATQFLNDVKGGKAFRTAAEEKGYEVVLTPFFDDDYRSDLGELLKRNTQVRRSTFAMTEINDISDVLDLGNRQVVFTWIAEKDGEILDFDQEKDRIKRMAEERKAADQVESALAAIRKKAEAEPEKALSEFAGEFDFIQDTNFVETALFSADNIPAQLDREKVDFHKDIYAANVGDFISNLQGTGNAHYVLARVKEKQEPDMSKYEQEAPEIAEKIRGEKGNELLGSYVFAKTNELDPKGQVRARIQAGITEQRR